jgi:superfamily I DNA/RNA helicase
MDQMIQDGDFVLCRTTSPLIETCLSFIRKGRKAQVRGREIGTGLLNLITQMGGKDIDEFLSKLGEYEQFQSERLSRMNKEQQLIELQDKVRCLRVFAEISKDLVDMRQRITAMFSDNTSTGITCMTVHKSKGLQAPNVYIIRPEQLPMKKDDAEEMRIKYVAVTRAQERLFFVS